MEGVKGVGEKGKGRCERENQGRLGSFSQISSGLDSRRTKLDQEPAAKNLWRLFTTTRCYSIRITCTLHARGIFAAWARLLLLVRLLVFALNEQCPHGRCR